MKRIIALFLSVIIIASLCASIELTAYSAESDLSSQGNIDPERIGDYLVKILDGSEEIELQGFYGNEENIDIPQMIDGHKVTIINFISSSDALNYYSINHDSIRSITIPDTVTNIYTSGFAAMKNLAEINVSENNEAYSSVDGILYNKDKTELVKVPICAESIDLLDSVIRIGNASFSGSKLSSFTIPDSVISIENHAFRDCIALTEIVIPNSVSRIGAYAFYLCSSLVEINIPDSVTEIGGEAFSYCTSLSNVGLSANLTHVGRDAFYKTPWYNSFPDGIVYLGNIAYEYKGYMYDEVSLTVREGTKYIADRAFMGRGYVVNAALPDGLESIGKRAFSCCNIREIVLPEGLTYLGDNAFDSCEYLESITIPPSLTAIPANAFNNCSSLRTVYGYTNSAAESFAAENGFEFVSIGESPVPEYLVGDVDSDAEVTILDATAIQRYLAGLSVTSYSEPAADADGDLEITILDATAIQRYLAGLSTNEDIGKKA